MLHIQSPWFDKILSGKKTIEGRNGPLSKFTNYIDKLILITNDVNNALVKIIDVKHYDNLYDYVNESGWRNIAPHTNSYEETIEAYRQIKNSDGEYVFSDEMIKLKGGINAIYIKLL